MGALTVGHGIPVQCTCTGKKKWGGKVLLRAHTGYFLFPVRFGRARGGPVPRVRGAEEWTSADFETREVNDCDDTENVKENERFLG